MNEQMDISRLVIFNVCVITCIACLITLVISIAMYLRSRKIDMRNASIDARLSAMTLVLLDLFPAESEMNQHMIQKDRRERALSILRNIDRQTKLTRSALGELRNIDGGKSDAKEG